MKCKNKLLITCILALIVCVLLVPCAFAEGEAEAVSSEQVAVAEVVPENRSAAEPEFVVDEVAEAEAEVPSSEFVADEVTETVAEPAEEPVIETEELKEDLPPIEEAAEAAEPESEEIIEKSEERIEQEGPKVYADFTAADGSVHSLELGSSVNLGEFLAALGYEGEVSSFASSNSDALDVNEEGQLVFKSAFADETITVIVNGEEVVIPVHDPAKVNAGGTEASGLTIEQAFGYQYDATTNPTGSKDLTITLTGDCETSTTLEVKTGNTITLDLNGYTLSLMENKTGSVILVNGTFTLDDKSTAKTGKITGGNSYRGGGVYIDKGGSFTMNSGSITGNRATNDGGGVYVNDYGSFTMNGGTISNNLADANGGGVLVTGENGTSSFNMTGGDISGNDALYGGGICVNYAKAIFEMSDGSINNNTSREDGGGVRVWRGTFTLENGVISGNQTANNKSGGGVSVAENATFNMSGGTISKNTAYFGGGVSVVSATFNMTGGKIFDNEANYGGGVNNNGTFNMYGGEITNNYATVLGGGINLNGTFNMSGGKITKNKTANGKNGGGVYVNSGTFTMNGGTIDQNEAQNGGGVYVAKNGRLEAVNGTITNCEATENGGGIYVANGGTATLNSPGSDVLQTGSSVTGCSAVNGGAIYSEGAIGLEVASITGNTATGNGGGICLGTGGSIFLGSTAKVTDNTVDLKANNLYISDKVLLVKIGTGEDVKEPQKGMEIGVTTESVPTAGAPVDVTTENGEDYSKYFFSDNTSYIIVNGEGNKVQLSVPEEPKPIPTPGAAIGKVSVYVDGKLLTEGTDYNWVNGKVVLTAEFVATLEAGEHTLTIEFSDNTVNESFNVSDEVVIPAEDAKYLAV